MAKILQLTRAGVLFSGSAQDLGELRAQFGCQHCLLFREFLDREVSKFLLARTQAKFNTLLHDAIGAIGHFQGRVYRMVPGEGHHDHWHNDLVGRMIGMSINLSQQPYSGGIFQLRHRPRKC